MNVIRKVYRKMQDKLSASAARTEKHPLLHRVGAFLLMPLVLLMLLFLMQLANGDAIIRFFASPYFIVKLLVSYIFLLAAQCFFWCITQRVILAVTINSLLFYLLGLATEIMIAITGDPLLPTDFLLLGTLGDTVSFVKMPIIVAAAFCGLLLILFLLGCFLWHKVMPRVKLCWWKRVLCSVAGLAFFAANVHYMCIDTDFRHGFLPKIEVGIAAFNPVEDYREHGLILEFFPRIGDMLVEKMDGYSENKIAVVEQAFSDKTYFAAQEVQPNIICIQSEALWDVYDMEQTKFNVDPMKNIREIGERKNAHIGKMSTSVFGGGTCLPEFEALTGLNCRYLLSNGYPYVQYITSETPSIVSTLRDNGYQTVAFHPYHKNFYSRNSAYPLLGFMQFDGAEEMENPEKSGWYVSDAAVTEHIIDTYEQKPADMPLYMFTVTMQNHGAYKPARYTHYDVEIENSGLDTEGYGELLDFTQGVYEADVAFKALVDYFETVEEPTVIVMYGDHLPLLGVEGKIYREGGYVENTLPFNSPSHEKLHETPYVVWANYDVDLHGFGEKISAGKIGLELLRLSGVSQVPPYFNTLYAFYEALPVVNPYFVYDANGNKLEDVPQAHAATENAFRYIQYDILHGKHYVAK